MKSLFTIITLLLTNFACNAYIVNAQNNKSVINDIRNGSATIYVPEKNEFEVYTIVIEINRFVTIEPSKGATVVVRCSNNTTVEVTSKKSTLELCSSFSKAFTYCNKEERCNFTHSFTPISGIFD